MNTERHNHLEYGLYFTTLLGDHAFAATKDILVFAADLRHAEMIVKAYLYDGLNSGGFVGYAPLCLASAIDRDTFANIGILSCSIGMIYSAVDTDETGD